MLSFVLLISVSLLSAVAIAVVALVCAKLGISEPLLIVFGNRYWRIGPLTFLNSDLSNRPGRERGLLPGWMAWTATVGAALCLISLVLWFISPRALFSGGAAIGMVAVTLVMIAGTRYLQHHPSKIDEDSRLE